MNWRNTEILRSKNEVRPSKIKLNKIVIVLAICLSLVTAAFSQVSRSKSQSGSAAGAKGKVARPGVLQPGGAVGLAKPQGPQLKLTKPEKFPLMIYLLDRYAQGVPDKTNFDRAVERALAGKSNSRELARQLVAGFRSIPLQERKAAYGEMADLSAMQKISEAQIRNAFKPLSNPRPLKPRTIQKPMIKQSSMRMGESRIGDHRIGNFGQPNLTNAMFYSGDTALHLSPISFTQEPMLQLNYQGLFCGNETRLLDGTRNSDEIYIITLVLDHGTGVVRYTRHPYPSFRGFYGGVDSGEVRNTPVTPIWSGYPQDLTLTSVLIERDSGNPERFDDLIDAFTRAGAAAVAAAGGPVGIASAGFELLGEAVKLIVRRILKDDLIGERFEDISASELLTWAHTPMTEWRPSDRQPPLNFHFDLHYTGRHSNYRVYFGVPPIVDLPPPTPVTVRIHKVKQISDLDRRIRGQADFRGRIIIAGEERRFSWRSSNEFEPTYQWFFTKNVHGDNVTITLKLYEHDPRREEHCDINPLQGAKDLTLTYNRATGRITGPEGTGVDGMRGRVIQVQGRGDNNRAEIWFSVDLEDPPI